MVNRTIAQIFFEIGEILEKRGMPFKPQTYQQAAITIDALDDELIDIYGKNGVKSLMDIPAIGDSMAAKIEEYLLTGKIKYYEELKKEYENR